MQQSKYIIENSDNSEWAIQSEYWNSELAKLQKPRKLRGRNPNPLILSGHGNSMRIEKGTLLIKEGFTHYPQKVIEHRYFAGDLELPKTILLLDGSGSLSFDVLSWLSEQSVSLIRIKWNGEIAIVCNGSGYAANQKKVDWQRELRNNPEKRLNFAKDLIHRKLKNSIVTLQKHLPKSELNQKAIQWAEKGIAELPEKLTTLRQVRALEGHCAAAYFKAWTQLELNWKSNSKYPIPAHWKYYRARSAVHECKSENRRASDPINAMLNYAYAIKLSQLQIAAIGKGYHPMLGVMHHEERGKPSYILDLLEPERPKVDAAMLEFVQSQELSPADFVLTKNGTCRLSPKFAQMVVTKTTTDKSFDENK